MKEKERLQNQIQDLQKQISALPEGKLICCHNQNRYKWFQSDGHTKKYIPKSNRFLAEQLAFKKYLTLQLEEQSKKLETLELYLAKNSDNPNAAGKLLSEPSGYSELLTSWFAPSRPDLSSWMTAAFEHNPNYPEQLIHKTASGNLVRSKSEAMIDLFLHTHRIPFRYECALQLNEITLYPDFTIRHPKTGEYYYWEHFGRMDDFAYSKNAISKLQLYNSHGIIPSIHLITTYETKDYPLSSEVIDKLIDYYFL